MSYEPVVKVDLALAMKMNLVKLLCNRTLPNGDPCGADLGEPDERYGLFCSTCGRESGVSPEMPVEFTWRRKGGTA